METSISLERRKQLRSDTSIKTMTERIASAIVANRLVLFVGAGLSKNLNLPDWKELVLRLSRNENLSPKSMKEINTLCDYKYYSDAIERILGLSPSLRRPDELRMAIEQEFKIEPADKSVIEATSRAHMFFSKLYEYGAKKIVTTNFDDAIDICINKPGDIITPDTISSIRHKLLTQNEYYLKIHGGLNQLDSTVLFKEDYRKRYILDDQIPTLLKELFTHNIVLFLGCGLSEEYMDIYEKLRMDKAVMESYVICTKNEHKEIADRNHIQRITVNNYKELEVILELILLRTQKAQRERSKDLLFMDLPLKDYNYKTAHGFFKKVSDKSVDSCYFFNTQVRFSEWFSPSIQMHLSQQMDAYLNHHASEEKGGDGFQHYRILFLPYEKRKLFTNINSDSIKQDIKAMYLMHRYMHCDLAFITTDVLKTIIEQNRPFFSDNTDGHLTSLGLDDLCLLNLDCLDTTELNRILEDQNENGYRNTKDLDFAVIRQGGKSEIWQANYDDDSEDQPFKYNTIKNKSKNTAYYQFSKLIIDYFAHNKSELCNPSYGKKDLKIVLGIDETICD